MIVLDTIQYEKIKRITVSFVEGATLERVVFVVFIQF